MNVYLNNQFSIDDQMRLIRKGKEILRLTPESIESYLTNKSMIIKANNFTFALFRKIDYVQVTMMYQSIIDLSLPEADAQILEKWMKGNKNAY